MVVPPSVGEGEGMNSSGIIGVVENVPVPGVVENVPGIPGGVENVSVVSGSGGSPCEQVRPTVGADLPLLGEEQSP